MKSRDKILFAFPLLLWLLVAAVAGTLFFSTEKFDDSYIAGEKRNIMVEANTVADVIRPMLAAGDTQSAAAYCTNFPEKALRVTLVRADGSVLADSKVGNADELGNHASREEIALALAGTPNVSTRFSTTGNARMIYCAMPVQIDGETKFVIRLAVQNEEVSAMISDAKRNVSLALALGVIVSLVIAFYIFRRVRLPLVRLQESAQKISQGNLNERISIPEKGIVRELAITVSRMKEQLKSQLDRISAESSGRERLFSALSEAVLLFSEDGSARYFNKAAQKIFRIDPAAPKFDLTRCGSPELIRLAQLAFAENKSIEEEITLESAGTPRTLLAKGGIIVHDGRRSLLLAVTDLTNLRRLESFRSDFIANVSHEIKTPLTGILGAADALQSGAISDPKLSEKFLGILSDQSKRLNALVQDILSLAAIERQQVSGDREMLPFRLDAALENAVNSCLARAESAGTALKITRNDPVTLTGDVRLTEQAIINLVGNALKHSGSPSVEISLEKTDAEAVVAVRDFGVGIAPEHCGRIFERFYSADKAHSRALGGTGLGLAIVKHIARLHGGNVSVESTPGKGSTFRIVFPLAPH